MPKIWDDDCEECEGKGYVACHICGGDGRVFWPGVVGKNFPCMTCKGTGKEECFACNGTGKEQ